MKIITIGTWTEGGSPTGWVFDGSGGKEGEYCLGMVGENNSVITVNGVEMIEWTEERKRIMAGGE